MNRFFRSALFPLIVIAVLVWLAIQTLSGHGHKTEKADYGQAIQRIETNPDSIKEAVFNPNKRELTLTLADGKTRVNVHYPSDQSVPALERKLEDAQKVNSDLHFDSKGTGSSAWWSILTGLLPFVLLIGFWIFLMNQVQGGG